VPAGLISTTLAGDEPTPARGASVRPKKNLQELFDFRPSDLKITKQHFARYENARYEKISEMLDGNPEILEVVHQELERGRKEAEKQAGKRASEQAAQASLTA
jgi:hypothetical protein